MTKGNYMYPFGFSVKCFIYSCRNLLIVEKHSLKLLITPVYSVARSIPPKLNQGASPVWQSNICSFRARIFDAVLVN